LICGAAILAFTGCGQSKKDGDTPAAGRGGNTAGSSGSAGSGTPFGSGGKAGAGATAGVGGTSGVDAGAGVGGTSGVAGIASAGRASGAAGMAAGGGSAGASARGGTGGSAGTRWDAACDGTSTNGRCEGDVFVWCDYYTKGLRTFDCATLGMTCQADARQPPEDEVNGCAGGPCPVGAMYRCEGRFIHDCAKGLAHVTDCEKTAGPGAICTAVDDAHVCLGGVSCGPPSTISCDGTVEAICNEYGELRAYDCARCNPLGTCGGGIDGCTPSRYDCDLP
jgi:hypothetical protein